MTEIYEACTHEWGALVHGGMETMWLLDESAHAIVNGLWLSSLLCSHAACERHLAGLLLFHEESLPPRWRQWGLGTLLDAAKDRDMLPDDLHEPLSSLNEARKVSAHFKPPLHNGSLFSRAMDSGHPDAYAATEGIAEADAFSAYATARALVHRARVR
ncbi:hypothetical protein [Nocardioides mangrovi]|uniref:Uncharacterized protein n=1 Tax=Nocardioides mangrovi TaxID=2874580 RepID=A0ABS7UFH6_9ACTN|nr:hypothetical protein [Nocardioides mangrovi]MBZ5739763.1 hypothetical protein [Nocardioides mangrovi]